MDPPNQGHSSEDSQQSPEWHLEPLVYERSGARRSYVLYAGDEQGKDESLDRNRCRRERLLDLRIPVFRPIVRGNTHTEYDGKTLRSHLGLARPERV